MPEPDPPPIEPGRGRLKYDKARRTIVAERPKLGAETIQVDGVWYDRRDTVDALNELLADARAKIEQYKEVIRGYRLRDLEGGPPAIAGVGEAPRQEEKS